MLLLYGGGSHEFRDCHFADRLGAYACGALLCYSSEGDAMTTGDVALGLILCGVVFVVILHVAYRWGF